MAQTKAVTVKLDVDLYETASDIVALTGLSFRELFSAALQNELDGRLEAGGDRLKKTLRTMKSYRQESATATA